MDMPIASAVSGRWLTGNRYTNRQNITLISPVSVPKTANPEPAPAAKYFPKNLTLKFHPFLCDNPPNRHGDQSSLQNTKSSSSVPSPIATSQRLQHCNHPPNLSQLSTHEEIPFTAAARAVTEDVRLSTIIRLHWVCYGRPTSVALCAIVSGFRGE